MEEINVHRYTYIHASNTDNLTLPSLGISELFSIDKLNLKDCQLVLYNIIDTHTQEGLPPSASLACSFMFPLVVSCANACK